MAALLSLVSAVGGPTLTGAQTVSWQHVVDAYLEGRADEAARLLEIPPDEAERQAQEALELWTARARLHGDSGPRARDERRLAVRRVQASALLPLEVLVRVSSRMPAGETLAPLERVASDAWKRLAQFETLRLDLPGDRERRGRAEDRRRLERFRERWQVAFLQYIVNVGRHRDARNLSARLRLSRDDAAARAEAHLLAGMLDEVAARMADEGAVRSAMWSTVPISRVRGIGTRLDDAHRAYGQALAAVPTHREARLRLGRIQLERRRPSEAIATLAPLRTAPCTAVTCGLAWLFTGEAREATSDVNEAASAYVHASTVLSLRQSALVALIELSLRRDNARQAFELTSQFTAGSPLASLDRPDAWSEYLSGRRADADAVLTLVREAMVP